jgi:hypothetical protein
MNAVTALPLHRRIADARAAIEVLDATTRAWRAFAPSVAAVDSVTAQADAVARALRELKPVIRAEFESTPPEAA